MRSIEGNPFDRNPPFIRFLLHSKSLADEVLSTGTATGRLLRLNALNEVVLMALPVESREVQLAFLHNGIWPTEYYVDKSGAGLKSLDGSIHGIWTGTLNRDPWDPVETDSSVAWLDVMASSGYRTDYFVVGRSDPFLTHESARAKVRTAEQALELVRILLTAHGQFYVQPHFTVDELLYSLYRVRKLFSSFEHAWTVAVYTRGKTLPEGVYTHLNSLSTRLRFFCKACDSVSFYSLKAADVYSQENALYHLAYMVMLATGVLDDLAHIATEFHGLRFRDRRDITLRIPEDKETTDFYKALQSKNADACATLTASATQQKVNAFYPMRDCLQHREFLKGLSLGSGTVPGETRNLFELSDEAARSLGRASGTEACIIHVHRPCLDPLPFVHWSQATMAELVNSVLSSIRWDVVYQSLSPDIQGKIVESAQRFEQGIGKALGWTAEPLYF